MFSLGKVVKLRIIAYEDDAYNKMVAEPFVVQINPSQYQRTFKVAYTPSQVTGQPDENQQFKGIEAEQFNLEFVLDGTGVVANDLLPGQGIINAFKDKETVAEKVKRLKSLIYDYIGENHQPRFIKIVWGDEHGVFKGVLTNLQVTYTLFDPEGKPLRAKIVTTFKSHKDGEDIIAKANPSSPDLTHMRLVKEGDTLPLMAYTIYGDSSYYLEVAKANRLLDFRRLKVGTKIYFPPIEKEDE